MLLFKQQPKEDLSIIVSSIISQKNVIIADIELVKELESHAVTEEDLATCKCVAIRIKAQISALRRNYIQVKSKYPEIELPNLEFDI